MNRSILAIRWVLAASMLLILAACGGGGAGGLLSGTWQSATASSGGYMYLKIADSAGSLGGGLYVGSTLMGSLLGNRSGSTASISANFVDGSGSMTFSGTVSGSSLPTTAKIYNASGNLLASGTITFNRTASGASVASIGLFDPSQPLAAQLAEGLSR